MCGPQRGGGTGDEEHGKVGRLRLVNGKGRQDDTARQNQNHARGEVETTLSVAIRRPGRDQQQDCAEAEGRDRPEVGLDDRVVVSTDDLREEVGSDGGGGTVAESDGGEDPELEVAERGEEGLHGELGFGRCRPIGEESELGDLLLPRRQESGHGRGPRKAEVHEDGESTGQSALYVSGEGKI